MRGEQLYLWGCGAIWEGRWFQVVWSDWPDLAGASIAVKELLPIIGAAAIWGHMWRGKLVLCHCDNQGVVSVIRGGVTGLNIFRDSYMGKQPF